MDKVKFGCKYWYAKNGTIRCHERERIEQREVAQCLFYDADKERVRCTLYRDKARCPLSDQCAILCYATTCLECECPWNPKKV